MGTMGKTLLDGITPEEVADALDRLHAYHLVALHWSEAIRNRLSGPAAFFLEEELEATADASLASARKLARRIAELGGAVTADPRLLVDRSALGAFEIPDDTSDVGGIIGYAIQRVRAAIGAYREVLERIDGRDAITERLLVDLLAAEVTREDEMENTMTPVGAR